MERNRRSGVGDALMGAGAIMQGRGMEYRQAQEKKKDREYARSEKERAETYRANEGKKADERYAAQEDFKWQERDDKIADRDYKRKERSRAESKVDEAERQKSFFTDNLTALNLIKNGDWKGASEVFSSRSETAKNIPGVNFAHTDELDKMSDAAAAGNPEAQQALVQKLSENASMGQLAQRAADGDKEAQAELEMLAGRNVTRGQSQGILPSQQGSAEGRAFDKLIENMPPEEQNQARRVRAKLDAAPVGSALITMANDEGLSEKVADSQATIKERAKFGEMTGSSRAKAIDTGLDRIQKISKGVKNIDRAIEAVRSGANTGAIAKRFPSISRAAVELDQIADSMALDVIGSVTLGAISEAELDLARQVALPKGLKGDDLIEHLQARKAAQGKLRAYFEEQIDHLDQGGTVASFLRKKKRVGGSQDSSQGGMSIDDLVNQYAK